MNMRSPVAMLKLWEHAKRDESLLDNHFRNRVPEDLAELYAEHIETISLFAGDPEFAEVNARLKAETAALKEASKWYEDRRSNTAVRGRESASVPCTVVVR